MFPTFPRKSQQIQSIAEPELIEDNLKEMPSPPSYRYFPLASPRHIRLLALRPAFTDAQPIICSLKEVSLDDYDGEGASPRPYEALSYTWGARTGTIPILCDGKTLLVTPNCESALRHLRQMFKDRLLWIDAACINQQSVEEKNVQVPLMGEIYSAATRAVIWLGPGLPGDAGMMVRARTVGNAVYLRVIPGLPVMSEKKTRLAARLMCTSVLPPNSTMYVPRREVNRLTSASPRRDRASTPCLQSRLVSAHLDSPRAAARQVGHVPSRPQ